MKKAAIIASFGTSYTETRKKTLDTIEAEAKTLFTDIEIFRAYTSGMVRKILKTRDKITVPSPSEIIEDLRRRGFEKIYIQPTHIIPGAEYDKLKISGCVLGQPLLHEAADFGKIIEAIELPPDEKGRAVIFMGHGSYHNADKFYKTLEAELFNRKHCNVFIGTVEGAKTLSDILPELKAKNIERILLMPFMMVAGDHAENDMAGDDDASWKTVLEKEGYQVTPVLKGLGEYPGIRSLMYQSLKNIIRENP